MDYSVKLQKISKIAIAKRQLHQHELITRKHNRVLVGRTRRKIVKVLNFFLFLNKSVSGFVCIQEIFKKMEATT
jgi:Fe-S cluster biosynthesis and repair protein YggX